MALLAQENDKKISYIFSTNFVTTDLFMAHKFVVWPSLTKYHDKQQTWAWLQSTITKPN